MKKNKILHVGSGPLINRGVEKFIQNICENINSKKYEIDILTPDACFNTELERKIEEEGGKIIECKCSKRKLLRYFQFCTRLSKTISKERYEVIEIHTGNIPILALGTYVGKMKRKFVIAHTQNTHENTTRYKVQKFLFFPFLKKADLYFACSLKAGYDSFPQTVHSKVQFIPNAIDTLKYKFDITKRNEIRKQLNIEEEFVVGNVSAFTKQKNHEFLIDVFKEINSIKDNSILLLVGEGELERKIRDRIQKENLNTKVFFLGATNQVAEVLSAMDVFVFPSLWEGLGISVIEAQANGLPCICSDVLPEEVSITELYRDISLDESPLKWAEEVLKVTRNVDNENNFNAVNKGMFNIQKLVHFLEKTYERSGK